MEKILTRDDIILTSDGKDLYAPDLFFPYRLCVYGVIQQEDRPASVDLSLLTHRTLPIHRLLTLRYETDVGYLVLAVPFVYSPRVRWRITSAQDMMFDKGMIGGSPNDKMSNLFPDPTLTTYQGILFRVYISNYRTQLEDPITFIG